MATEKKPMCAEFLKDLPSYKKENFSRFVADSSSRNISTNKPDVRAIYEDDSSSQVIVTEKTSILLRYLHNQWDKKHNSRKRNSRHDSDERDQLTPLNGDEGSGASSNTQNGQPARKMPRTL